MEPRRSPTTALAQSLGIAVLHPSPQCDTIDHWRRPALYWVMVSSSSPVLWLKACEFCAANARSAGTEVRSLDSPTPPAGYQERLPLG